MSRVLPTVPRTEQLAGIGLVMVAAVGYGSGPFFASTAYDAGMTALPILFWRFLCAALCSWGFVLATGSGRASLRALDRGRVTALLLLGALFVGNSGTYVAALETVPVSLSAMISYLYPVMVAVLATRFGRRLEGRRAWVALGISTAGVMLAVGGVPQGAMPPLEGLLLAVSSPVIYAVWIILQARLAGERPASADSVAIPLGDAETVSEVPPAPGAAAASALMTTATAVVFAAMLWIAGGSFDPASIPSGAPLALVGFGAFSAAAVQAFYGGVRRIGGARASLLSTMEPVYTITLATLLLGDTLTPMQLIGGVLVIGGVLLAESGNIRGAPAGVETMGEVTADPTTGVGAVREAIGGG